MSIIYADGYVFLTGGTHISPTCGSCSAGLLVILTAVCKLAGFTSGLLFSTPARLPGLHRTMRKLQELCSAQKGGQED